MRDVPVPYHQLLAPALPNLRLEGRSALTATSVPKYALPRKHSQICLKRRGAAQFVTFGSNTSLTGVKLAVIHVAGSVCRLGPIPPGVPRDNVDGGAVLRRLADAHSRIRGDLLRFPKHAWRC